MKGKKCVLSWCYCLFLLASCLLTQIQKGNVYRLEFSLMSIPFPSWLPIFRTCLKNRGLRLNWSSFRALSNVMPRSKLERLMAWWVIRSEHCFLSRQVLTFPILSTTNGRYGLAASPQGDITSLEQLANKEIGVSSNTIIEYLADSLVLSSGVGEEAIKLVAVPKIPVRMELLLNGQIPAACLPEPLYSLVLSKGAKPLGDSTSLSDAPGVMIFGSAFTKINHSDLIRVFTAYWEAGQRINANPDDYREFLVTQAGFPQPLGPIFSFVTYTKPQVPSKEQIQKVVDWMNKRKLLDSVPTYESLVESFVVQAI